MDKFVVTGMPGFDGDYPIDIGTFTMRELEIIKRVSGVRAGELEEAFNAGDSTLILAVAVIAVRRNERDWQAFEKLAWESELGQFVFTSDEGDVVDPQIPAPPVDFSVSEAVPDVSGRASNGAGDDLPETTPLPIGSLV